MLPGLITPWMHLSVDTTLRVFETQAIVARRLFGMAARTVPALTETQRGFPETGVALPGAQAPVVEGAARRKRHNTGRKAAAPVRGQAKASNKASKKRPSKVGSRISRH